MAATAALVEQVRASVVRASSAALDELAAALPAPITSISMRTWPSDFPRDLEVQLRSPWEARADAVMYRQVLAEIASSHGWEIRPYEAKTIVGEAEASLGDRADDVLRGPRTRLGPPWTKDHVTALAATVALG